MLQAMTDACSQPQKGAVLIPGPCQVKLINMACRPDHL